MILFHRCVYLFLCFSLKSIISIYIKSQKDRETFKVLLGLAEGVSRRQCGARLIWEASTHPHVNLPFFATSALRFPPHSLSLFPCLLPPLTFQGKYYKNSFKQVFLARFGCLRRTVGMAVSRGIFLRNRTWAF